MEEDKKQSNRAREFRDLLNAENMARVDFDALVQWLEQIAAILSDRETLAGELVLLRQDLESRIGGMVRALVAVDRTGKGHEEALETLEFLPQLSGTDLIACYRRTSARFRDAFPTSFGLILPARSRRPSGEINSSK